MISLALVVSAFITGNITVILLVLCMVGGFWLMFICTWKNQNQSTKKNKIDKYGDDNYGTIDWLHQGKI